MQQKKIFTILAVISLIFILLSSAFLFIRVGAIFELLSDNPVFAEDVTISKYPLAVSLAITVAFSFFLFIVFLAKPAEAIKNKQIADPLDIIEKDTTEEIKIEDEKLRKEEERKNEEELEKIDLFYNSILIDLQKETNRANLAKNFFRSVAKEIQIVQGIFFEKSTNTGRFTMTGSFAYYSENENREFDLGEGLAGQVAQNKQVLNINNIPENYILIYSGLGSSSPQHLIIMPILFENEAIGIAEIASFIPFEIHIEKAFQKLSFALGEMMAKLK